MKKISGLKQQALFLTAVNAIVRMLGFIMRICTSRMLGAEILGIIEMAQSVHMMIISPVTSGLPAAISRLTAKASTKDQGKALSAGLFLVKRISIVLIPVFFLSTPIIGRFVGDIRVIPSLWFSAPCVMVLGYSAAYNGYCYGTNNAILPALSELIEQLARIILTIFLIGLFREFTPAWLAAIPTAATMAAELLGLLFVLWRTSKDHIFASIQCTYAWRKNVFKLAAPTTVTRLIQTFFRSATAIIIPLRLQNAGLTLSEATSQLGQLNGMVAPVLMLPGIFTSALSVITIPRMAKADEKPDELKRLLFLNLQYVMPVAFLGAGTVFVFSRYIAESIFHQSAIQILLKMSAAQMLLSPVCHAFSSTLTALGQQKETMTLSSIVSACMFALVWKLSSIPVLGIKGVILSQYANYLMTLCGNMICLLIWCKKHNFTFRDKCA